MKKFFALFSIPASVVDEWRKATPPEKMKAATEEMMDAWKKWMMDHEKQLVDKGSPLGRTKRVTANGVSDVRNDLNWRLIVEAESHEAAAKMFADHPHLRIPAAAIEVMEIPDRPGM
jgi:hypothetical protein